MVEKISLGRELRVHNLTMIPLICCGLVMFLNKVEENSLEYLQRGRRRRQCPYCLLTKTILKCTLAKLIAWNLFFFPVQAWCAACFPSFVLSLIACRLKTFVLSTVYYWKEKKLLNVWKADWHGTFFPWSFKCFHQCFLIILDNATDPFTNHCTNWRLKFYTQLKSSFLARFWQLLF